MSVTIYKYQTITARAVIEDNNSGEQSVSLMNEDILTLNFTTATAIDFHIGDYCYFFGKLYQINYLPKKTENAKRNLTYTLVLESEMYDLTKTDFLFLNPVNNFEDAIFSFRGTPKDYGDILIYNLNRMYPLAGWQLGNVIDSEFITQDFNCQNCLEALKTIASIFQTEYLIEGKTINIFQRQTSSGEVFQYGLNEALLSITQQNQNNANVITRLRAFGSTRNIDNVTSTYRSGSPRLRMPDNGSGKSDFLEKNVSIYNVFEKTVVFDGTTTNVKTNSPLPEIYPHRTGKITAIDDFLNFYDSNMDFDVNSYLITGITAQVVFNTGLLAGYTFDINSYNNGTKKFTINQDTSNPNLIVPTIDLTPVIGDQYVIINIRMPQTYIDAAENQLKAAAQAYLDANCIPPLTFDIVCNPAYFKSKNLDIKLGQTITIKSTILGVNRTIRIVSYKRNIRNPYLFSMTLADTVQPNSIIVKLINGI